LPATAETGDWHEACFISTLGGTSFAARRGVSMLRITRSESAGTAVLLLEGKLLEPWLDEVRRAIADAGRQNAVQLDLSGLDFVDPTGALLLATLGRRGIVLRAASPLVAGLMAAAIDESRRA
jgi:ABC-type transporter Mla MlaB component